MNVSEEKVLEFIGWLSADIVELHSVECGRLLDSWKRFKAKVQPVEPWGTWEERSELAKLAQPGDRWIQIKSGRVATVQAHSSDGYRDCIHLKHENGRTTYKWRHYFGQQFTPESPPQRSGSP